MVMKRSAAVSDKSRTKLYDEMRLKIPKYLAFAKEKVDISTIKISPKYASGKKPQPQGKRANNEKKFPVVARISKQRTRLFALFIGRRCVSHRQNYIAS
jgi:hypothetical protein